MHSDPAKADSAPRQETDAALLAAATRRDAQAFASLVARHYPVVYRVVWRMMRGHADAQDVAQEAFLRLWNNPEQVREPAALKGWLLRVASNLVMDRFRRRPTDDIDAALDIADGHRLADDSMAHDWARHRVDAAIAGLPERQRLALTLVHLEQMGNIGAAQVMGISVEALESLLSRGRRGLKQLLANDRDILLQSLAAGSE